MLKPNILNINENRLMPYKIFWNYILDTATGVLRKIKKILTFKMPYIILYR